MKSETVKVTRKVSKATRQKMALAQKRRWKNLKAEKAFKNLPQVKQQRKRFAKARVKLENTSFLQSALDEASKTIADTVKRTLAEHSTPPSHYSSLPVSWVSGDGRLQRISEMDEGHLRNTISYLQRKLVSRFGNAVWLKDTKPQLAALLAMLNEAERRGVSV